MKSFLSACGKVLGAAAIVASLAAAATAAADGARASANYSFDVTYVDREVVLADSSSYSLVESIALIGPEAPLQTSGNYSINLGEIPTSSINATVADWSILD